MNDNATWSKGGKSNYYLDLNSNTPSSYLLFFVAVFIFLVQDFSHLVRWPTIYICGNNDAAQLRVTARLICAFVFATRIVHFLFFLGSKFQSSILLLRGYSLIYVRPVRKPGFCFLTRRLIYCSVDGLICYIILYDT